MNLIMMGPVGSGKSTQAQLLAEHFGLSLLNVGDLLHFKSKEETSEGKAIADAMEAGRLVDDQLVLRFVSEHIKENEHQKGVVIDGFPRSLWQAEHFAFPIDRVVYLVVSDSVNKERLLKRGREDDTAQIIDKRLEIYHKETEPILDFYRRKGILVEVNGERSVDEIFQEISSLLEEKGAKLIHKK